MRIKLLAVLCLSTFLFLAGCKGDSSNANANANKPTATPTATPVVKTNESAAVDTVLKTKIEDALKKKGFTTVMVEATTAGAVLKGTYPKGKLDEVVATAQEAAGKPVKNEMTEAAK
jgi:PBP1b-binding outer membrane lipoprotein LpoB